MAASVAIVARSPLAVTVTIQRARWRANATARRPKQPKHCGEDAGLRIFEGATTDASARAAHRARTVGRGWAAIERERGGSRWQANCCEAWAKRIARWGVHRRRALFGAACRSQADVATAVLARALEQQGRVRAIAETHGSEIDMRMRCRAIARRSDKDHGHAARSRPGAMRSARRFPARKAVREAWRCIGQCTATRLRAPTLGDWADPASPGRYEGAAPLIQPGAQPASEALPGSIRIGLCCDRLPKCATSGRIRFGERCMRSAASMQRRGADLHTSRELITWRGAGRPARFRVRATCAARARHPRGRGEPIRRRAGLNESVRTGGSERSEGRSEQGIVMGQLRRRTHYREAWISSRDNTGRWMVCPTTGTRSPKARRTGGADASIAKGWSPARHTATAKTRREHSAHLWGRANGTNDWTKRTAMRRRMAIYRKPDRGSRVAGVTGAAGSAFIERGAQKKPKRAARGDGGAAGRVRR